jgi:hypothetical protein
MNRVKKLMLNKSAYLEEIPIDIFSSEMALAINSTRIYKPDITCKDLRAVWKQKCDDSLRTKIQSLARRKRGQWAAFVKIFFERLFLPHTPLPKKSKTRRVDDEHECQEDDGEEDEASDDYISTRLERFETGMKMKIDRTTLPNDTCCLALSKTRHVLNRYSNFRSIAHVMFSLVYDFCIAGLIQLSGQRLICTYSWSERWPQGSDWQSHVTHGMTA